MNTFQRLSKVALKHYPAIQGRVREIEYGLSQEGTDRTYAVAHVYWNGGGDSKCPLDRLTLLTFEPQDRYPWEKPEQKEKPTPDDKVGTDNYNVKKRMNRSNVASRRRK